MPAGSDRMGGGVIGQSPSDSWSAAAPYLATRSVVWPGFRLT